jgi:hypothetical protein
VVRANDNILGGHSYRSFKAKRNVYVHVSYSERFRDRATLLYSSRIVDKEVRNVLFNRYLMFKRQSSYSLLCNYVRPLRVARLSAS